MKTVMLFNLVFPSKIILSCFFIFFLVINLYFTIPAAILKIFDPIAELAIPLGMPSKEAKVEVEIIQY